MAKDLYIGASVAHSMARLLVRVIEHIEDDIAVCPEVDPMSRENITHVRRLTHALAEQLQQLERQADDLPEVARHSATIAAN